MSKRNRKATIAEARNDQPIAISAVVSQDSSHESQVEYPRRHGLHPWAIAPPVASGPMQPVSSR